jgi:hypothetical protein
MAITNLPRQKLLERAAAVQRGFLAEGMAVKIRFKFTCEKCGERCTLCDANILYETGECYSCGHTTRINEGGFSVEFSL